MDLKLNNGKTLTLGLFLDDCDPAHPDYAEYKGAVAVIVTHVDGVPFTGKNKRLMFFLPGGKYCPASWVDESFGLPLGYYGELQDRRFE